MVDSQSPERWTFRLLGTFEASLGERCLPPLPTAKATALLAYLALHREPVARQQLSGVFWRGAVPEAAANSLSAALSAIRRAFRAADPDHDPPLLAARLRIRLDPARTTTDVADFDAALRAAQGASHAALQVYLRRAIAVYGPGLLPNLKYDWQPAERRLLRQRHLVAADELLDMLEGQGQFREALELAESLLVNEPERELTHRQVMRLLARRGDRHQAEQHFDQLARLLAKRGLEPASETVRLAHAIRSGEWQAAGEAAGAGRRAFVPAGLVVCVACSPEVRAVVARERGALEFDGFSGPQAVVFARVADALGAVRRCLINFGGEPHPSFAVTAGDADVTAVAWDCPAAERATALLAAASPGQVLCDEAAAALARSSPAIPVAVPALGEYILADGGQLVAVAVLEFPDLGPRAVPPLGNAARPVAGLAPPAGRLFGRQQAIRQLAELCGQPETRLVTLTGPPGCGKSRVALAVARRLIEPLSGRVWAVSLSELPAPSGIVPHVLQAMQREGSGPDAVSALRGALAGAPALLLLDDLEHMLPAASVLLGSLLAGVPGLKLLITSREPCRMELERRWAIEPLPVPQKTDDLAALRLNPSVALFCDRTRRAEPSFALSEANAANLSTICQQLDGLPLGLELAAAAVARCGVDRLAAELAAGRDIPGEPDRRRPARQRSLQHAFDASYQLLTPHQQAAYRATAVFAGGFDAAAFEAVAGTAQLGALPALVDKSLLNQRAVEETVRFEALETIRSHAARLAEQAGETAELARRHASHFASIALPGWVRLGPPGTTPPRDGSADQLNHLAALRSAVSHGCWATLPALAANGVALISRQDDGAAEHVQESISRAFQAASAHRGEAWTADIARWLLQICRWTGDHETAVAVADEAVALARAVEADGPEVYCAASGMLCATVLHRHDDAARWADYLRGLRARTRWPGRSLLFLAQHLEAEGRFDEALATVHEASLQPDILAPLNQQYVLLQRYGAIYAELGQVAEAVAVAEHALRIVLERRTGNLWRHCQVRVAAIVPLCWAGHPERARHHARHAAGLLQENGSALSGQLGVRLLEQCLIAGEPELAIELGRQLFTGFTPAQLRPDIRHSGTRVAAELWARNHFHHEAAEALRSYAAEPLDWSREPVASGEGLRVAALLLDVGGRPREAVAALQAAEVLLALWPRRQQACRCLRSSIAQRAGLEPTPATQQESAEAALAAALGALAL